MKKSNSKFVLTVALMVLWALAGTGLFLYMIAQQFNCSFIKATAYALLCVGIPVAFTLGVDPLEARVNSFFRNKTPLPMYLTEHSMKLISVGIALFAVVALAVGLVLAVHKAPV